MTKRLIDAAGDVPESTPERPQRIAGPGELLQAVPYLLGFRPARSLVLVGLCDGILVVTARLDLSDATSDSDDGLLAGALASMCAGGTREVIAVVYDDAARIGAHGDPVWARLADRLARLTAAAPCTLHDVLLVCGERWWSYGCASVECCPPGGQPLPSAPSPFATRATVEGVVPLPDRAALAAVLDPLSDSRRRELRPLLAAADDEAVAAVLDGGAARHERSVKRALFATARASASARWQPPDDVEAARFAAALTSIPIRDAVWLAIDARRLDGRALWRDLARRAPAPYDAPALLLFGWASWRAGNGALAGIAAARAVESDPGYSAADLLLAALAQGVDPRRFPRLSRTA